MVPNPEVRTRTRSQKTNLRRIGEKKTISASLNYDNLFRFFSIFFVVCLVKIFLLLKSITNEKKGKKLKTGKEMPPVTRYGFVLKGLQAEEVGED